jgi:hypothetical protein
MMLGLLAATGLHADWLEFGRTAVRQQDHKVEIFRLRPASFGGEALEARLVDSQPIRVHSLVEGEKLFLVSYKHEDPRPQLRQDLTVLAEIGGTSLVVVDARGQLALDRLLQTQEDFPYLRVREAPTSGRFARAYARGAASGQPHPVILAACDALEVDRWSADITRMVDFGSRNSKVQGIWDAAEWAKQRFLSLGLENVAIENFSFWGVDAAPNVRASLFPGAEGESRPIVLVGAHLDSINFRGDLAPGADDNASGSAAVLEAARILSQVVTEDLGVEFRFALFSGEEQGLYGSKAMAKKMAEEGELERIRAAVIMDMIAFDQGGPLNVTMESLAFNQGGMDHMAELAALYTSLEMVSTTNAWGSDHMPFLNRGVPTILPIEGEYDDNPHDHTGHDVQSNLNPDMAAQMLRLVVASLLDSAGVGAAP